MIYLFGIKDKTANAFLQYIPYKNVSLIRRELSNVVNTPSKSLMYTNCEDFSCFQLGVINEETGKITSLDEPKLEFNFTDLKTNVN